MNVPRAVTAGTWLLDRAGIDEALAGDLAERAADSGSLIWYWRQVVSSILLSWTDTLATHKWLAVRAIVTGWIVWAAFFAARELIGTMAEQTAWAPALVTVIRYGNWIVIGWAIGMLHRPYHGAMVLAYIAFTIVMSIPLVARAVSVVGHPSYNAPSASMIVFAIASLTIGGLLSESTPVRAGK